jgi:predicted NBD/HSP70 family sugar kinase
MNDHKQAIGVDLGATIVKKGVVAADGTLLYQNKFPTRAEENPSAVIEQISCSVSDAMNNAHTDSFSDIGIGAPGMVDNDGFDKASPNIHGWGSVSLGKEIHSLFPSLRVKVENAANAAKSIWKSFIRDKSPAILPRANSIHSFGLRRTQRIERD